MILFSFKSEKNYQAGQGETSGFVRDFNERRIMAGNKGRAAHEVGPDGCDARL